MKNIITFPIRGNPPPCPEGYEPVPGYPFSFQLKYPPCVLRNRIKSICKKKKEIIVTQCEYFDVQVNPVDCLVCKVPNTLKLNQPSETETLLPLVEVGLPVDLSDTLPKRS